jgi:uncharacterized protein (DUF1330 family)
MKNIAALKSFYRSTDYQALVAIRKRTTRSTFLAMEGV